MCPYCGEEVPDDSKTCWKCGTELTGRGRDGGEGDDGDDGEATIEQRGQKERGGPRAECPHCQALIPVRALRCNECGKVVKEGARRLNWVPAAWTAFGVVVLATLIGLVYSFVVHHKEPPDPGRDAPVSRKYGDLERIYFKSSGAEQRKREVWEAEHQGKFVEWEGVILKVDPADRRLELAESGLVGKTQVVVELKPGQDLTGLKEEKTVRYSARLVDFRGGRFELDLGLITE